MTNEQKKKISGLAIASLVCGLLFLTPFIGIFFSVTALILGIIAISAISKNKETIGGNGLAIAGIILGSIGLIIAAIILFGMIVAVPRFVELSKEADMAAERGVTGGVKAGIYTYYAQHGDYPLTLDDANVGKCAEGNPCFTNVLLEGVNSDWEKTSNMTYLSPTGTSYTYSSQDGSFE